MYHSGFHNNHDIMSWEVMRNKKSQPRISSSSSLESFRDNLSFDEAFWPKIVPVAVDDAFDAGTVLKKDREGFVSPKEDRVVSCIPLCVCCDTLAKAALDPGWQLYDGICTAAGSPICMKAADVLSTVPRFISISIQFTDFCTAEATAFLTCYGRKRERKIKKLLAGVLHKKYRKSQPKKKKKTIENDTSSYWRALNTHTSSKFGLSPKCFCRCSKKTLQPGPTTNVAPSCIPSPLKSPYATSFRSDS